MRRLLAAACAAAFLPCRVLSAGDIPPGSVRVTFLDVARKDGGSAGEGAEDEYLRRLERNWGRGGIGDSAVVETSGKCVLIDGGLWTKGRTVVLPYLRRRGVKRLDAVVLTHQHGDHYGGLAEVVSAMPVGEVLTNGLTHSAKAYRIFMEAVEESGAAPGPQARGEARLGRRGHGDGSHLGRRGGGQARRLQQQLACSAHDVRKDLLSLRGRHGEDRGGRPSLVAAGVEKRGAQGRASRFELLLLFPVSAGRPARDSGHQHRRGEQVRPSPPPGHRPSPILRLQGIPDRPRRHGHGHERRGARLRRDRAREAAGGDGPEAIPRGVLPHRERGGGPFPEEGLRGRGRGVPEGDRDRAGRSRSPQQARLLL